MSPSPSQLLLAIAVFVFIVSFHKALTEDTRAEDQYTEDKRHVGVLARTGGLPSLGKRYVASLARNGELPFLVRKEWHKKMHPVMSGGRNIAELLNHPAGKRYIGALARSGNLPFGTNKRSENGESVWENEDEDVNTLLKQALDTENLWRIQLKTLRQKLLEDNSFYPLSDLYDTSSTNEIADNIEDEKRSFAALARNGNLPTSQKRSVEALARAGYLPQLKPPQESEEYGQRDSSEASEELLKRNAAGLSRNGNLKGLFQEIVEGKRGGLGSLARNGYLRNGLDHFSGKRGGIGSLARSGTLRQKKFDEEEENDELEKLISELNYLENYDDSAAGYFGQDFSASDSEKRNIGSLARARDFPFRSAAKKGYYFDIDDNEQKRNLASVLRNRFAQQQGKRNLGSFMRSYGSSFVPTKKEDYTELDEQYKRNIGSMAKNWLLPEHIKNSKREVSNAPLNDEKNVSPGGPDGEKKEAFLGAQSDMTFHHVHKKSAHSAASDAALYEGKNSSLPENDDAEQKSRSRSKREAYYAAPPSEEYPLPVLQNSDLYDYEDLADLLSGGAPKKRFLGRIPQMGRNRPRTTSHSGRRRPQSRNI